MNLPLDEPISGFDSPIKSKKVSKTNLTTPQGSSNYNLPMPMTVNQSIRELDNEGGTYGSV